MHVAAADAEGIEMTTEWRTDFVSAPERQATHGGIVASLLDSAAVFAVIAASGSTAATVDLRVDYHGVPAPGTLRITGRVLRLGRRLCTADASLYGADGRLAASGRATVMVLP